MSTVVRYVQDVVKQVLRIDRIVVAAVTDPSSEPAVLLGLAVSIATGIGQAIASGRVDWVALVGLVSGLLVRPTVSPASR